MSRTGKTILIVALAAAAFAVVRGISRSGARNGTEWEVTTGPLEAWTSIEGTLESRQVSQIMSRLGGPATLVEITADGAGVLEDDVLARFDSAQLERDVLRLERDRSLAREDLSSLTNARLPLEMRDIEARIADARTRLVEEEQALKDDEDLHAQGLISDQDVRGQRDRLQAAAAAVKALEEQMDLTTRFIHPSQVERAKATLKSAEQELELAGTQLSNCVMRSPAAGVVGYKPLNVGGEFRNARVGDTLFKNQPFMTVSDMTNIVLHCDVPEAELMRFPEGCIARVTPIALPDIALKGRVEAISSTARTVPGRGGQRYFTVTIGLEDSNPRLRSGMTAQAEVLSCMKPAAVLLPRAAVTWERGTAYCNVKELLGVKKTALKLGMADERNYEVMDGVKPGRTVVTR